VCGDDDNARDAAAPASVHGSTHLACRERYRRVSDAPPSADRRGPPVDRPGPPRTFSKENPMNSVALIGRLTANPQTHAGETHESATFRLAVA